MNTAEKPLAAFVHVPKTAGTSLRSVVAAHYGPERTWLYQATAEGFFQADGAILNPDKVGTQTRMKPLLNVLPTIVLKAGISYAARNATPPESALAQASAAIGHVPFATWQEWAAPRPVALYTVVREPLERMVSHYRYMQQNRRLPRPFKGWMVYGDAAQPFDAFALSEPVRNVQTSYTGTELATYEGVGISEDLDGFLRRIGMLATSAVAPQLRVGAQPFERTALLRDPGFRRAFEDFHADDYAFYEAAKRASFSR
jgi:hypothetical protein